MVVHWPDPLAMLAPREARGEGTRADWCCAADFMLEYVLMGSDWSSAGVSAHANPAGVSSDQRPMPARLRRMEHLARPAPEKTSGIELGALGVVEKRVQAQGR